MTKAEALKRAIKAVRAACDETDSFDHGGMTSWEVTAAIEEALRKEFAA